jgi:hypothetical protein
MDMTSALQSPGGDELCEALQCLGPCCTSCGGRAPVNVPMVEEGCTKPLTSRQSTSTPVIVAAAIASMREAVPSPLAGPPRAEPIGGARSPQLVADVVNQECLCVLVKCRYSNIFHLQGLFVEQIVLVASFWTVKVMDMMIIGGCNACASDMLDMQRKYTKAVHTSKVIFANVGRKAKHVAGEACPSRKLVTLGLVYRQ